MQMQWISRSRLNRSHLPKAMHRIATKQGEPRLGRAGMNDSLPTPRNPEDNEKQNQRAYPRMAKECKEAKPTDRGKCSEGRRTGCCEEKRGALVNRANAQRSWEQKKGNSLCAHEWVPTGAFESSKRYHVTRCNRSLAPARMAKIVKVLLAASNAILAVTVFNSFRAGASDAVKTPRNETPA